MTTTIVSVPTTTVGDCDIGSDDFEGCRSSVVAVTTVTREVFAGSPGTPLGESSGASCDREDRESLDVQHVDCWERDLLTFERLVST